MSQPQSGGVIDQNDIQDWKNRVNKGLKDKAWSSASPPDARPWSNSLWGCCSPASLCIVTCCLPCVTFGKTHHRLRKNGDMRGYEAINTSCLAYFVSSYFCFNRVMTAMQSQDIREKHNLEGSCMKDLACSFCCGCCVLMQQEKESKLRYEEGAGTAPQQYKNEQMVMPGGQQH